MEKKKFIVYKDDEVNYPVAVFSADTIQECKECINEQVEGLTPVDDEHPCTDDVMYSSHTFLYEVYEGEMIIATDGDEENIEWVYASDYYYSD